MKAAMVILWPSFIFGAIGAALFFILHDPADLSFVGALEFGRRTGYTVGFLLLWGIAAGSSWLTWLLAGTGNARR